MWLVDVSNSFTLAMVGTTISSLRMVPQTRLALSRAPLWGLCPWSTVLVWLGMALWLAYAVMVGDVAVALCSVIGLVMQSAILAFRLPRAVPSPRSPPDGWAPRSPGSPARSRRASPHQRSYQLAA